MAKNVLDWIALVLVIIGGILWGLMALNIELLSNLGSTVARIVEGLVGLAALYTIYYLFK